MSLLRSDDMKSQVHKAEENGTNDELKIRIEELQEKLESEKAKQRDLKKQMRNNKDKANKEIFQWKCKYEALLTERKGSQKDTSDKDTIEFGTDQIKIVNVPDDGKKAVIKMIKNDEETTTMEQERNRLKEEIEELRQRLKIKTEQIARIEQENHRLKEEDDTLRMRLSEIAGSLSVNKNPIIDDLSDVTRPTKLAKIFSELYDNQWTQAFEDHNGSKQEVIKLLLRFLTNIHTKCQKLSSEYMSELEEKIIVIPGSGTAIFTKRAEIPASTRQFLLEIRKSVSEQIIRVLITHFIKKFIPKDKESRNKMKATSIFIEKCTELCWYMAIKDPPVTFGDIPKEGELVNKELFRSYTRSGKYVDYCVWPPLLLCEDGALLCKGIIQGK